MSFRITHFNPDRIALIYLAWYIICTIRISLFDICSIALCQICVLTCVYIFFRILPNKTYTFILITILGTIQAIFAIAQQIGIAESNHVLFNITGFMGNPGQMGGVQAIAFISTLLLLQQNNNWHYCYKLPACIIALIILYSILLSKSRSAFIALFIGLIILFYRQVKIHIKRNRTLGVIMSIFFVAIIAFMYFQRTESVHARLLIWRICMNMIADKPLFGFGTYGFNRYYMLYQAEYFKNNPNSTFIHVADNAAYPYNEFIHIIINQGMVGLILFIIFIYTTFRTVDNIRATAPLVTLIVFSCFSFPSFNILSAIILPMHIANLIPNKRIEFDLKHKIHLISLTCIALFCTIMINIYKKDYYISIQTLTDDTITNIYPTCENWCSIGEYYMKQKEYAKAEHYFKEASFMIPTRISPNYLLWKSYLSQGKINDADSICTHILTQPIKVKNTYTIKIQREIKEWKTSQLTSTIEIKNINRHLP